MKDLEKKIEENIEIKEEGNNKINPASMTK